MIAWSINFIPFLFNLLLFFVPLVLFPKTSELFEFNKMVLTYTVTVTICASWLIKMVMERRIIFRRTILDTPLLIFLAFQILSTAFSIDPHTSLFGYYSRFHGGLLSYFSYALLYWAYVSNMDWQKTKKAIQIILTSACLVSIYGVLEHFGIDKEIWVQDVQNRVFSTLGQPNWLAAWLVALIPITWVLILNSQFKLKHKNLWLWNGLSILFFLTLLYTKSRSGILGFALAYTAFWSGVFWLERKTLKIILKRFLLITSPLLIITFLVGTPWTPNLSNLLKPSAVSIEQSATAPVGPALEVGGTESGEIRKIVWRGAVNIWKNYPVLGSGVETFAYSYYNFRPVEHNLVSEWDFLYNKAHNEYLNFAATTGSLGLLSYLGLIGLIAWIFSRPLLEYKNQKSPDKSTEKQIWILAFLSGFSSILITNFFGFSVVPVTLIFFLYPAMATSLEESDKKRVESKKNPKLSLNQKILLVPILLTTFYILFFIGKYWYADIVFAEGKLQNDQENYARARELLTKTIKLSPTKQAIYYDELSESTAGIALSLSEAANEEAAKQFAQVAISESDTATKLSPANLNLRRNRARLFIKLSSINPDYLFNAKETLVEAIKLAPTDAKLYYNLALTHIRLGEIDEAMAVLEETIAMKSNYRNARLARALLLADKGEVEKAQEELLYILEKIDPEDELVRLQLEEISN